MPLTIVSGVFVYRGGWIGEGISIFVPKGNLIALEERPMSLHRVITILRCAVLVLAVMGVVTFL